MRHNRPKEYIGVDVGSRRVGLARGSSAARLAEPLKVVPAGQAMGELAALAQAADGIVVGLPRGLDGQETAQTAAVRIWVKQVKGQIDKPIYWQDEALTSRQAADKLQTSSTKHQTYGIDAWAACVILQDFLDMPINQRVRC